MKFTHTIRLPASQFSSADGFRLDSQGGSGEEEQSCCGDELEHDEGVEERCALQERAMPNAVPLLFLYS